MFVINYNLQWNWIDTNEWRFDESNNCYCHRSTYCIHDKNGRYLQGLEWNNGVFPMTFFFFIQSGIEQWRRKNCAHKLTHTNVHAPPKHTTLKKDSTNHCVSHCLHRTIRKNPTSKRTIFIFTKRIYSVFSLLCGRVITLRVLHYYRATRRYGAERFSPRIFP